MYADNMTKSVRDTWLSPWNPPMPDGESQQHSPTAEISIKPDAPKSPKVRAYCNSSGCTAVSNYSIFFAIPSLTDNYLCRLKQP